MESLQPQSVVLKRQLGSGSQGCVFLAGCTEYPDLQFAAKVFLRTNQCIDDIVEVQAYRRLGSHCSNVLGVGSAFRARGHCDFSRLPAHQAEKLQEDHIILPMELCCRTLLDTLKTTGRFDEEVSRKQMQGMLNAISFAHAQGVAHGDLKPGNILYTTEGTLRVADWGAATITAVGSEQALTTHITGTDQYVAPEVLTQYNPGAAEALPAYAWDAFDADTWSLGVILFAMLSGTLPFHKASLSDPYFVAFLRTTKQEESMIGLVHEIAVSNSQHGCTGLVNLAEIRDGYIRARSFNVSFVWPSSWSRDVIDLVRQMLTVNPAQRIGIDDVRSHPWFARHIEKGCESPTLSVDSIQSYALVELKLALPSVQCPTCKVTRECESLSNLHINVRDRSGWRKSKTFPLVDVPRHCPSGAPVTIKECSGNWCYTFAVSLDQFAQLTDTVEREQSAHLPPGPQRSKGCWNSLRSAFPFRCFAKSRS
eukprot:gb/GECG01007155.1/.p1 GENE.gb/GECG01007155.1/~~gb/GECG01007155.1/.p1  ORF type:complete len:480 (+),score=33.06 gb/GECG01007155.1/:1-1440(+)